METLRLALVGDYVASFPPHAWTADALKDAERRVGGLTVAAEWIATDELVDQAERKLRAFDAVWVAPGSPYKSMQGALNAIRYAREQSVPLLGTCGGCQHVVIEYARNVLGFTDAAHAEYDPYASNLFVTPLSCSLVGQSMEVLVEPNGRIARAYGRHRALEQYYCNFGINPQHQQALHDGGLRIVGRDAAGEARILILPQHIFFVATLFVPQLLSEPDAPHPLLVDFLKAGLEYRLLRTDVAAT